MTKANHRQGITRKQSAVVVVLLVLLTTAFFWVVHDPVYSKLDHLPLVVELPRDIELVQIRRFISFREGMYSPIRDITPKIVGKRYVLQFIFEATSYWKKRHDVEGKNSVQTVRFILVGRDGDGRVVFRAKAQPIFVDLPYKKPVKFLLRVRNMKAELIDQLESVAVLLAPKRP